MGDGGKKLLIEDYWPELGTTVSWLPRIGLRVAAKLSWQRPRLGRDQEAGTADLVTAGGEADDTAHLFVDVSQVAHVSDNAPGFRAVNSLLGQGDIAKRILFVVRGQRRQQ